MANKKTTSKPKSSKALLQEHSFNLHKLESALDRVLDYHYTLSHARNGDDNSMGRKAYHDMMITKYKTPDGTFKDPEALLKEDSTVAKQLEQARSHAEKHRTRKAQRSSVERE